MKQARIVSMTAHLGGSPLAEGVAVSRLESVTAGRGILWRNSPMAGVTVFYCASGSLAIVRADATRAECRAGELLVLFPRGCLDLTLTAPETTFTLLELTGPQSVRALLAMGFWDGFLAPHLTENPLDAPCPPRTKRDASADGLLLDRLGQNLEAVWQNCRLASDVPEFFSAVRAILNLPTKVLTTEEVAVALGVSRSKLNSLFLAGLHIRPGAFLSNIRAEVIADFLTSTSLSVGQIAERTGFSTTSALAAFFKRLRNCTPSDWRSRWRIHFRL